MAQVPDRLTSFFIHMARDGSEWCIGASLADRTGPAGFLARMICPHAGVFLDPTQGHFVSFKAGVGVTLGVILEMAEVVFALSLVFAVQHRNMRCDLAVQQPNKKWPRAV